MWRFRFSPREAGSGLATGRRQHQPMVIRKEIDKATPLLYRAWAANETLKTVQVRLATAGAGVAYSVTLTNASIASIKQGVDSDGRRLPGSGPTVG